MTIDEAIQRYTDNAEYERTHGNLQGWWEFTQLVKWLKELNQEPVLDKIRAEIAEYGSICVAYAITDKTKTDEGIKKLVSDVLKQAKEQVLDIIDKYKVESEVGE